MLLISVIGIVAYVIVACVVLMMQSQLPVMFPLAVIRSAIWPVYLLTGWPRGEPLPMD